MNEEIDDEEANENLVERTTFKSFGHIFKDIFFKTAKELATLEQEGAIYSTFWDDKTQSFRLYRIKFLPIEIFQYVEALLAEQEFDNEFVKSKDIELALEAITNPKIREQVRNYKMKTKDGKTYDRWICQASFLDPDLEALVCGSNKDRYELVMDQHGKVNYATVLQILNTVSSNIRYLSSRRNERPSYVVEHEFDLQDLVYVCLKGVFPDAKIEEYTPKIANSSTRVDIVLPSHNILIECKIVRDKSHSKTVLKEIMIDIESYYVHPHCSYLFFIVFDPEQYISDPDTFSRDLSGLRIIKNKTIEVEVLVK